VIARQYKGKTSMTILNGTSKRAVADMKRYAEIIGSHVSAENVITGQTVRLDGNLNLTPRQTMIVEF
jgi:hypothetical protein